MYFTKELLYYVLYTVIKIRPLNYTTRIYNIFHTRFKTQNSFLNTRVYTLTLPQPTPFPPVHPQGTFLTEFCQVPSRRTEENAARRDVTTSNGFHQSENCLHREITWVK